MPETTRLPLSSPDFQADRLAQLQALFPEAFSEGRLDLERLGAVLGQTDAPERYQLTWSGKGPAIRAAQAPSTGTLLPDRDASLAFDTAEHLILEGDNLEVLKLLQRSYHEQVKVIYIDPPYNTGTDFVYPDDYAEPLQAYLARSGQRDAEGRWLTTNAEAGGRFHSNWLSMMYPRLFLARQLLRRDGVLFAAIDDHEVHHLRLLLDEIFGPENFVATLTWRKKVVRGRGATHVIPQTEYIHVYAKDKAALPPFSEPLTPEMLADYKDRDDRGPYKLIPLAKSGTSQSPRPNLHYPIPAPDGTMIPCPTHQWRWSRETFEARRDEVVFRQKRNGEWSIFTKQYLYIDGEERERTPTSYYDRATTTDGTEELKTLFGEVVLDFPKPTRLVRDLIAWATDPEGGDLVLDFFAGSGTTGHAVLLQNAEDGGNRRFVLVQLPEPTGREDYPTIADITRARVSKAFQALKPCSPSSPSALKSAGPPRKGDVKKSDSTSHSIELASPTLMSPRGGGPAPSGAEGVDTEQGYRAFRLANSCFTPWNPTSPEDLEAQLRAHISPLRPDRSEEDILFELLLKAGLPLTTPIESLAPHTYQAAHLLISLQPTLTEPDLQTLLAQTPEQLIVLDTALTDALKTLARLQGVPLLTV